MQKAGKRNHGRRVEPKKTESATVSGIECLWGSKATNVMIKIKHNKHYELKIRSNKVEYSTAAGLYCTTHDVKVHFCMPEFSSSKIINHCFHVNNNKGELVIGYDMIIVRDLMVQIGLMANFKRQVIQWYGAIVHMKEPISFLGKSDLTKRDMRKMVRQTEELASTQEDTG